MRATRATLREQRDEREIKNGMSAKKEAARDVIKRRGLLLFWFAFLSLRAR
jgi:hypothetical protein